MSKTISFNGKKIKYDEAEIHKWSTMKELASGTGTFDAIDRILCGKSDEVAQSLGDDVSAMHELIDKIATVEGNAGKNR